MTELILITTNLINKYEKLKDDNNKLEEKYERIEKKYKRLEKKYETLQETYATLLEKYKKVINKTKELCKECLEEKQRVEEKYETLNEILNEELEELEEEYTTLEEAYGTLLEKYVPLKDNKVKILKYIDSNKKNEKNETIIVNNILKEKSIEFVWRDITNQQCTPEFDLYKDFDKVINHFKKEYINIQYNYHRDNVKINDIELLFDEYFIGVYYAGVDITHGFIKSFTDQYFFNIIFYTNYGNIIDFSFRNIIVCGGANIISDVFCYYNNQKITFINQLNLIIQKQQSNIVNMVGADLNDIILNLYELQTNSEINILKSFI